MEKTEFEELTKERVELAKSIDLFFENPKLKEWNGADVEVAFPKGVFLGDNWNDRRINLFRALFHYIHNEWVKIGNLELTHLWHDDENYVNIKDSKTNDLYHVEWYKSRGCTSEFLKNGKPITLQEFKALISELLTGEFVEPIY
jgi:hypothetical protein